MTKSVLRLNTQFQPSHYELHLFPERESMTLTGSVTIEGKKVGRPSQRITLHQHGLVIDKATITHHYKGVDQPKSVTRINNQDRFDEVRLHSSEKLFPGNYTLTLEFHGKITSQMDGIYPCLFMHEGTEKSLIATQFESHDARKAFPCVDEPEAKATFSLTLTTPEGETVLSNTPLVSQQPAPISQPGFVESKFERTPRMSTYLLAFVFGELGYTEATTKEGVIVRAYATPDNVSLTRHATEVAINALTFFSDYFQVPYPLKKLDMVALPDFSSGAMENWGLVTYRETTMLYDEQTSSIETKQYVALVIAHELSHQWFGNLVTMQWWNDLWLNESFANLMEHRAVDALYPDWHIWELFISSEAASAKRRDSLADVQPVRTDVHHPDEITTLFDPSIVYAKGGTILYMLMNHIGEEAFRAGLSAYFQKFAYHNTTADDLWNCLSAASQQDVGAFMDNWVNQPGYPLVRIDYTSSDASIKLSQERFVTDQTQSDVAATIWHVPLQATVPLSSAVLTNKTATVNQTTSAIMDPVIFNHDGLSYYLPKYVNAAHLESIVDAIASGKVSPIDRLSLIDNYTMLQRGGKATTTELLNLLKAYAAEENENVWSAVALAGGEVRKLIEGDEPSETSFNRLLGGLVAPLVDKLGWDDRPTDSPQTLRLRGLLISMAAGASLPSVIEEAKRRFLAFEKPADLPASSRTTIYFVATRYGSKADFDKLLSLHNKVISADERDELASGLTSVKDESSYKKLLDLLTTKTIRRQDLMHWYVWLLRNRYARKDAWDWMTSHWDWITTELRGDKSYNYFPRYAGSVFSYDHELEKFDTFFADKRQDVALARNIALGSKEIESRVRWRADNEAAVKEWLAQ